MAKVTLWKRPPDEPAPVAKIVTEGQPMPAQDRVAVIKAELETTVRKAAAQARSLVAKMGDPGATAEERAEAGKAARRLLNNPNVYDAYSAAEAGEEWDGVPVKKAEPSDGELRAVVKRLVREGNYDALKQGFAVEGGDRLARIYTQLQHEGELSPPWT